MKRRQHVGKARYRRRRRRLARRKAKDKALSEIRAMIAHYRMYYAKLNT